MNTGVWSEYIRNPALTGFTCQAARDEFPVSGDGYGRNGTLISPTEVLWAGHYNADVPMRWIWFVGDDNKTFCARHVVTVRHPVRDLALSVLDREVPDYIVPAKIFTEAELGEIDYYTQLICINQYHRTHIHDPFDYHRSIMVCPHIHVDGDSGCGVFLRTDKCTYLIGKMFKYNSAEWVFQERIDEMRELLP